MGKRTVAPKKNSVAKRAARDGITIDDTAGAFSFTVELNDLPMPIHNYSADVAGVVRLGPDYCLVFQQLDPFENKPKTSVTIRYSKENFFRFVEKTLDFFQKLRDHLIENAQTNLESDPMPLQRASAEKALTERAALERVSFFGGESEISFYRMSANYYHSRALRERQDTSELISPVLSVQLPSEILFFLLKDCQELQSQEESK
jgi:hypothetical protein